MIIVFIHYSLGAFCFLRKRGLSKSNDSHARRVYSCPSAGRGSWGAQGSRGHQQHASSRGAPQYPPGFQGTPFGTAQRSAFNISSFSSCEHPHKAQRILTVQTKVCIFVTNSVDIVTACITSLCRFLSARVRCCHFSTTKGCICPHLSSHFPSMPRRSHLAWRIARYLCCVQGNKCPLFSPIRIIRFSLDVLRKSRTLALLSDVLPYGKCKPQEIVMVLHHFRQGLAPARFSKPF